jgi:MIP family channel proteins
MFPGSCAVLAFALGVVAEEPMEMVIDAQGEIDATVMLQTPVSQMEPAHGLLETSRSTWPGVPKFGDVSISAAAAEYVAMTLFVVIGCGSAMGTCGDAGWVLQVALTFGFAISSLAYAIGHYSGGQINCAVTVGLLLSGHLGLQQAVVNVLAQMLGSIIGAFILTAMHPEEKDKTKGVGANKVDDKYTCVNALIGEASMTFFLMFVVLETAINPATKANRTLACVAIGLAVFLAHSVLIPIDGCSINPTRSFGPALVKRLVYKDSDDAFKDHWVFWLGPLSGAAGAVLVSSALSM